MGHLSAAKLKQQVTSVEVVSDDSQRVLRFSGGPDSFTIAIRDATESEWSATTFATLSREDAKLVSVVLSGADLDYQPGVVEQVKGVKAVHRLPAPEVEKGPLDGDCTPLDIERAKAENLKEERENIQLQMERDHSLDRHASGDVPGCPACDRKVIPSAMPEDRSADADPEDLPF